MRTLGQDLHYGFRMLKKNPGFTFVAVLTLALGIGANTAIFSLIDVLLLRPLPGVKDPQQLMLVTDNGWPSLSYSLYEHLREARQSLSGLFVSPGVEKRRMMVTGSRAAEAERISSQAVSGNFFSVLGASAVLGRTLTPDDDRRGDPQPVAVISYDFWDRRFRRDPAVIGKMIMLDDMPMTIVGVAPRGFLGFVVGSRPDLWWPIHMGPQVAGWDELESGGGEWLQIAGRLKPGVAEAQARDELDVLFKRIRLAEAEERKLSGKERQEFLSHRIELRPAAMGFTWLRREFQKTLLLLMTTAGLVLLIACTNLAGLLLARGAARQREFNLRAALGAGRLALIRQLGTESLLLAGVGGGLGLLLAQWGVRILAGYIPGYGTTVHLTLTPDLRILTFTFAVSVCTGMLFGLIPAWCGTRLDVASALKEQSGAVPGRESGRRWSPALVVFQIALSCCLLIGAGLFARTLHKLVTLDVGLNRKNLLVFDLDLGKGYDNDYPRWASLRQELLRRLEGLPGAVSATFSNIQSLGGNEGVWGGPSKVAAPGSGSSAETGLDVRGTAVGPRYFATMGIPLRRGRSFTSQDELAAQADPAEQTTRAVVIDETSARRLFGAEDPVGKVLQPIGRSWPLMEVIGVAQDVMHKPVRWGPRISIYALDPRRDPAMGTFFYLRTLGDPLRATAGIRQMVRELDPQVEVSGLQTVSALFEGQLRRERTICQLAGFFSLSALALACLGLYGILSYGVARRTREIGLRMALGAQTHCVLSMVIRRGMVLVLVGCGLGVLLALVLTRLVSSLLYGVTPADPVTFVLTTLLFGAVAFVSCWLPARRAARIDPMAALRCE